MANYAPRRILGKWRDGFALDIHTLSSIPIGYNEYGHMQLDTTRSELGDLLYRLKFKSDDTVVPEIADAAASFVKEWKPDVEIIVPVPPSTPRVLQPVSVLGNALSRRLSLPLVDCVQKTRDAFQLKNVYDLDERLHLLEGLHAVDASASSGRRILLFDDLYRSGATMNSITNLLYDQGEASDVFALTITRTRSHR
jgi:competence protein ComFC